LGPGPWVWQVNLYRLAPFYFAFNYSFFYIILCCWFFYYFILQYLICEKSGFYGLTRLGLILFMIFFNFIFQHLIIWKLSFEVFQIWWFWSNDSGNGLNRLTKVDIIFFSLFFLSETGLLDWYRVKDFTGYDFEKLTRI
jgi:hypothetical protein